MRRASPVRPQRWSTGAGGARQFCRWTDRLVPASLPLGDNGAVRSRPISDRDLDGLRGLRRDTRARLLLRQPATVFESLCIRGIGRRLAQLLFSRGVLSDPEGMHRRSFTEDEFKRWRLAKDRDRHLV